MTHELKTPLTTILGYAQILRDNGFTDQEFFDKGMNYIIKESQRLNTMVADILEVSVSSAVIQAYRFERIDVSDIIREACEDMSIKAGKYNIGIHYELEEYQYLQGDRDKLKEVFLNVLDNSVKYSDVNSIIEVQSFRLGETIAIVIRDQGKELVLKHSSMYLNPFTRIRESTGGEGQRRTGLVYCEKHRGASWRNSGDEEHHAARDTSKYQSSGEMNA